MDFNAWRVDNSGYSATHDCGFTVTVEGNPASPMAVKPGRFPKELSSIEQVRLLRHGVEAIAQQAKVSRPPRQTAKPPQYAGPRRSTLSLKRKETEEA